MILFAECGLEFHRFSGVSLPTFGTKVMDGIWGHPLVFDPLKSPALPCTKAHFLEIINATQSSYSIYDMGGKAQKPDFEAAFNALISLLNDHAVYVNAVAKGDFNIILVSGFTPVHGVPPTKSVVPGQATSITVTNGSISGILDVECESFGANHHYGCIVCEGHTLPEGLQIINETSLTIPANLPFKVIHNFDHSRKKVFSGLTKGLEYYFYFYVFNNAGVGPLSVVVSKMCS